MPSLQQAQRPESSRGAIAIVGMACRFPDARSPAELWENVLAQRRAFRCIPSERLLLEDYNSCNPACGDSTYVREAGLIEGYEFDRVRFRVSASTFRSVDLAHWLALDTAAQALADAGFPEGEMLPRDSTGVLVGNSLTGEFSRAGSLRLRWPFVRRVAEDALAEEGVALSQRESILARLKETYLQPFAPTTEETLAGGLSNVIAGRICNHFNLRGGGYTLDGACASSLLAIISASAALESGELDVALAGGVDLSLDPFELVGFAKVGALARGEMRVYDSQSDGFLPGEGCGFVVLMRHEDALQQRRRIYAVIRGWGISSDGAGGITRPEAQGQVLALERAYRRAGFGIETVSYLEGHGTGTKVGDLAELQAIATVRRNSGLTAPPSYIGSVKANIGHTKAAAGVAGLLKAVMALDHQVIPPTTGCQTPHAEMAQDTCAPRVLEEAAPWPADRPLRAGVSAMGFGGINTHVVLEGTADRNRAPSSPRVNGSATSTQDGELVLLSATDRIGLLEQVEHVLKVAPRISRCELTDLAAHLSRGLVDKQVRAAIVAGTPEELVHRLEIARASLRDGITDLIDVKNGTFLGQQVRSRVTFLFPGQGGPLQPGGGALAKRFRFLEDVFSAHKNVNAEPDFSGAAVQPATVLASLAGMRILTHLGIEGSRAAGHSLGELVALHWAGAFDDASTVRIAEARGQAMDRLARPGSMAAIGAAPAQVRELLNGSAAWVACLNSPRQTVISGEAPAVSELISKARTRGLSAAILQTTHAFHSPLVAEVLPDFEKQLDAEPFKPLERSVFSTVTGTLLAAKEDLRRLLCRQVVSPVLFNAAVKALAPKTDLFIEVGAGSVLTRLVSDVDDLPAVALEVGGSSLRGLLHAVGAVFALGMPVSTDRLFTDRFCRPFDLNRPLRFFANPCESAPTTRERQEQPSARSEPLRHDPGPTIRKPREQRSEIKERGPLPTSDHGSSTSALEVLKQVLEERLELPAQSLRESDHLLRDLHLNSLSIGQIVAESARRLGLPRPASPTEYSHATLGEIARTFEELRRTGATAPTQDISRFAAGVDSWVRTFTVQLKERPAPPAPERSEQGTWQIIGPPDNVLTNSLKATFAHAGGSGGVVVHLPQQPDEMAVAFLLDGAQRVLARSGSPTFVLLQHGGGGGAFARSLCLEAPHVHVCVVDVPPGHPEATQWVLNEARSAARYREAHYDTSGRRYEPFLCLLPKTSEPGALPLGGGDVMLVTGGGKGIAAECARALARDSGMRLALLGRSNPHTDADLAANLERLTAAGVRFRYVQADVADEEAVRRGVAAVERDLGPITAVMHGAGINSPQLISTLNEDAFQHTLTPKFRGLQNVLSAVRADQLRVLITFGSVIARTGFRGEADYGLANEWISRLTQQFQLEHPGCRCLCVEWSIWSGVGMGERLGRVGALLQEGITPITADQGVSILRRLLCDTAPACVVVSGRLGEPPTLRFEEAPLPRRRFLEDKKIHYPGVELVIDSHLSSASDLYVQDHVFGADRLFPAVMGLEAIAQAASALVDSDELPAFDRVEFLRPITVPDKETTTLRLAALVRDTGVVEVSLRTSQTEFQVDHFRATCRFSGRQASRDAAHVDSDRAPLNVAAVNGRLPLEPSIDLYGDHLFQRGRFKRLEGYRRLSARECIADLAGDGSARWFGPDLPGAHILGDPGLRDAALHAVQACIPHAVVLPVSVEHIRIWRPARGPCRVHAVERMRNGDSFRYDLDLIDADGQVVESWQGLCLKATQPVIRSKPWPTPLLKPFLEREFFRVLGGRDVDVVIGPVDGRQCARAVALKQELVSSSHVGAPWPTDAGIPAVGEAGDSPVNESGGHGGLTRPTDHRPDGRPEGPNGVHRAVSFAYGAGLLLGVSGDHRVLGCDLEAVVPRSSSDWEALLGPSGCSLARQLGQLAGESFDTAATRVWTVLESAKKAGLPPDVPLTIRTRASARPTSANPAAPWVVSVGKARAATCSLQVEGCTHPLVVTVLSAPRLVDSGIRGTTEPIRAKAYEHRHVVTFEDTNLLGNVYYVNYLSWQGRCRELFLRDHAPSILVQLREDLRLVTVRVSCRFTVELAAFDELLIRMTLKARKGNRLKLAFEYLRLSDKGQPICVARGTQVVACMRREGEHLVPTPIPQALLNALKPYAGECTWKD